jgi:hypothetical protein
MPNKVPGLSEEDERSMDSKIEKPGSLENFG